MKSKTTLGILFGTCALVTASLRMFYGPLDTSLPLEVLSPGETRSDPDHNRILPYGHTLGPWPTHFQGEPIVSRLTYRKGPPKKFIETLSLIWSPMDAEISLLGPKTVLAEFHREDWKACFAREFLCRGPRKAFWDRVFPDRDSHRNESLRATWFESGSPEGPQGVHLQIDGKSETGADHGEDRFAIITPDGVVQVFSIQTSGRPAGVEARELFVRTLASLKVQDDLAFGRAWIAGDLKQVNLSALKKIPDEKTRYLKLIEVQNLIFAHLSVDPGTIDSFYHLAGVTHRLAMDLLHTRGSWFRNQESWLNEFPGLLSSIAKYSKDFPESGEVARRIDLLLQDFLLEQKRVAHQ